MTVAEVDTVPVAAGVALTEARPVADAVSVADRGAVTVEVTVTV